MRSLFLLESTYYLYVIFEFEMYLKKSDYPMHKHHESKDDG